MPADALILHHLTNELQSVKGGRIDRIYMPTYEDIIILVRATEQMRLLISCSSNYPRCCLVNKAYENPDTPFGFLMHLRKHLSGGIIKSVEQIPSERVLKFTILSKNNMFTEKTYCLFVELMGKFSNVILVDETGKISDSAKHLPIDVTSRAVIPGIKYTPPPAQINKREIGDLDSFADKVSSEYEGPSVSSYLLKNFIGFAPVSLKEAVYRAGIHDDAKKISRQAATEIYDKLKELYSDSRPQILFRDGKPIGYYPSPYICERGDYLPCADISEAVEKYHELTFDKLQISSRGKKLQTIINNHIKRCEKNSIIFANKLSECDDADNARIMGDLIISNIYRIKQGDESVTVDNYYTGEKLNIPLDKTVSPSVNAKRYYKKYEKSKHTLSSTTRLIDENDLMKDYLESLSVSLDCATTTADFDEIEREMSEQHLIREMRKTSKQAKHAKPMELRVDGFTVLIGKNNYQNDALVKNSPKGFLWLHAQKIHGSHAIIQATDIPQDVINKVAAFCAYYSKASASANVPVDYTLVKYVKKPAGAPPGKVTYINQQTVNVTPQKP